jgi:protein AATF/BFR2
MGLREDLERLSDPAPSALVADPEDADALTERPWSAAARGAVDVDAADGDALDVAVLDTRASARQRLRGVDSLGPKYAGRRVSRAQVEASGDKASSSSSSDDEGDSSYSYEPEAAGAPIDESAVSAKLDRLFAGLDGLDGNSSDDSNQSQAYNSSSEASDGGMYEEDESKDDAAAHSAAHSAADDDDGDDSAGSGSDESSGSFSYSLEPEGGDLDSARVEAKMDRLFDGLLGDDVGGESSEDQAGAVDSSSDESTDDDDEVDVADQLHSRVQEHADGTTHDIQAAADLLEQQLADQESHFEKDTVEHLRAHEGDERRRGRAVRGQRALWDEAMNLRISLQPVLDSANRLPRAKDRAEFISEQKSRVARRFAAADTAAVDLFDELLEIQGTCVRERMDDQTQRRHGIDKVLGKRRTPEDRSDTSTESLYGRLSDQNDSLLPYYRATISEWSTRLQPSSSGAKSSNRAFIGQTPLEQIDRILGDKDRLRKRSRTCRMQYDIFGERPRAQGQADDEVYDDLDWYQFLLKEVIETGPSAAGGAHSAEAADSAKWFQTQKIRRQVRDSQKVSKQVDRRASKGRKLRFNTHEKLVGFLAPRAYPILLAPAGLGGARRAGAVSLSGPLAADTVGDTVAQQLISRQQPAVWHDVLLSSLFRQGRSAV